MFRVSMLVVLTCIAAVPLWSQSAPVSSTGSSSDSAQQTEIPAPLQVSEKEMRHLAVKKVHPVYSPFMLQTRIQGTVKLRVFVDKSGVPTKVTVVFGHPVLLPASIDAAKQWRYKPYLVKGNPVEVETENTFQLVYPQ
jgi:protein TonB